MLRVAVLDVGLGNLRSVERALERAAADAGRSVAVSFARAPDDLTPADAIVFPGQGAFRDAAKALAAGLGEALRARIAAGTPYLGICLGLQALFDSSEEAPDAAGLGVFRGRVVRIPDGGRDPATGALAKVPHIGWNQLEMVTTGAGPLAAFDDAPPFVYFVHSYQALPEDPSLVAATVTHGPHVITAAVARENVTGVQFHPEKSQAAGLLLLERFLRDPG
ncbi:MAG TPA: imidazole glycerol phosphate synthase subunit HisH [Minicystis sp.]|nr:imidazole glycerol phosphate synthase subunit HisH [Minicystis sp.]